MQDRVSIFSGVRVVSAAVLALVLEGMYEAWLVSDGGGCQASKSESCESRVISLTKMIQDGAHACVVQVHTFLLSLSPTWGSVEWPEGISQTRALSWAWGTRTVVAWSMPHSGFIIYCRKPGREGQQ